MLDVFAVALTPFHHYLLLALLGGMGPVHPARAQGAIPVPRPAAPGPYQAVDARMRAVPDSSARTVSGLARFISAAFLSEPDRARAAFGWVARHIRYDTAHPYRLEQAREPAAVAQETLDKRRGVCQHYAELYSALANQAGVLTYVVPGYASLRDPIGHAWCASRINGQWYLMEPTWAAGRVVGNKFAFRFNNDYFKVRPAVFIESHMPFDPLWQLLRAPRTPQQFQLGTKPPTPRLPFAFADSVAAYGRQSSVQQLQNSIRRIEQNGGKSNLIFSHLNHLHGQEENCQIATFNAANQAYNDGAQKLNDFMVFFHRQFLPRQTDAELKLRLPPVAASFARSRELLTTVRTRNAALLASMQNLQESLQEGAVMLGKNRAFMDRYFLAPEPLRPTLFTGPDALNVTSK